MYACTHVCMDACMYEARVCVLTFDFRLHAGIINWSKLWLLAMLTCDTEMAGRFPKTGQAVGQAVEQAVRQAVGQASTPISTTGNRSFLARSAMQNVSSFFRMCSLRFAARSATHTTLTHTLRFRPLAMRCRCVVNIQIHQTRSVSVHDARDRIWRQFFDKCRHVHVNMFGRSASVDLKLWV